MPASKLSLALCLAAAPWALAPRAKAQATETHEATTTTPMAPGATAVTAPVATPLSPTSKGTWAPSTWGARLTGGIGTATAGDWLMFELGAELRGWRTLRQDVWLLRWQGWAVGRGGQLADQHPFLWLLGGDEHLAVSAGRRFQPDHTWSPYLGLYADEDARWLWHPGLSPSSLDTVNNVDGVGGFGLAGTLRLEGGLSLVDGQHALLLTALVGEQAQRAQINLPAFAFTTLGGAARFDTHGGFSAEVEVWWGATPVRHDVARGFHDRTTRTQAAALLRHTVGARMWLSLASSWTRDEDRLTYDPGNVVLHTADAPTFTLTAACGWTLGGGL